MTTMECKKFPPVKIASALVMLFVSIHVATAFDATATTETNEDTHVFSDIDLGHKHYVAIKYLKEEGLIEGYEDGSFKPLDEINRAEALKILTGALTKDTADESPEQDPSVNSATTATVAPQTLSFPDVPEDAWYYGYVLMALENGVVQGYPDGLFHPENTINRAESLKIALLLEGDSLPEEITEPPYSDVPVDVWFAPYATVSAERSLIIRSREDESLYPDLNMNRGDFADLVYRLIKSRNGNRFAVTTWYGFEDVDWSTASGEDFDTNLPTAAHKTLPFGTYIKVTNLANGKTVTVKINDRGPYARGMDLDLTSSSFETIASLGAGVIVTEYEIIENPNASPDEDGAETTGVDNQTSNEIEYGF